MNKQTMRSVVLRHLDGYESVFWAGVEPPLPQATASTKLFNGHFAYRQPTSDHGAYSAVALIDCDIGHHPQWPVILDEALRLIAHGRPALLCVRFSQVGLLSVFAFAGYLERRRDFTFELVDQHAEPDASHTFVLSCTRAGTRPTLANFEFSLITTGSNLMAVESFVASAHRIRDIDSIDWSIAICGPEKIRETFRPSFAGYDKDRVRFVDEPDAFRQNGWITRKKNLLVATSNAENVLVAHDRFSMSEDFLDGMRAFGPDFSVIVPRQLDSKRRRVGDWVAIESQWGWAPQRLLSYDDYEEDVYVNGGVIIAKQTVLADCGWSELLFWNQAEDVELTRRLTTHGITPRIAPPVVVNTPQPRTSYASNFRRIDRQIDWQSQLWFPRDRRVSLRDVDRLALQQAGLIIWASDWACGADGLRPLGSDGEVTLKYNYGAGTTVLELEAAFSGPPEAVTLSLNGLDQGPSWICSSPGKYRCSLSLAKIERPVVDQLVLWISAPTDFRLLAIGLHRTDARAVVQRGLTSLFRRKRPAG